MKMKTTTHESLDRTVLLSVREPYPDLVSLVSRRAALRVIGFSPPIGARARGRPCGAGAAGILPR